MSTPTPDEAAAPTNEPKGKTAKELQQEEPPPGLDQQPPTNPAGEPHLA